ncbi:hypothetical protein KC19_VG284500 [Ceratodon purpureus]|uniref:Protein ABCI12, chloroplastic n=1 Tax=Ceratodon purpureus TaxID=3225 RepID=A0A8T0HUK6_CERPU|nr:hypothetical protein KC19_VG284500 [Ceratodon purpureus]
MVVAMLAVTLSSSSSRITSHESLNPGKNGSRVVRCGLGSGCKSQHQISCLIFKFSFSRVCGYQIPHGNFVSGRQWRQSRCLVPRRERPLVVCEAEKNEEKSSKNIGDRLRAWLLNKARRRQEPLGERIMRTVAGASSAPITQYIPFPVTSLHTLDPRVKQAWLLALVVLPARSHMAIKIGMVIFLALATMCTLPRRIWQDQLGRMALLSGFLFVMLALGTDGIAPVMQSRRPLPLAEGLPKLPAAISGYNYVLLKLGPYQLTRKGVSLAAVASCLSFTVLQSASLCLTTTTPEQLAAALRWYLTPLTRIGAPVEELILTLLLSLRFIGIVFDEVKNLAVGVVARNIDWKALRLTETADTLFNLFGRIFKNLFIHADQISQTMIARGYRGNPVKHHIYFLTKPSMKPRDWAAIVGLLILLALSMCTEFVLPV